MSGRTVQMLRGSTSTSRNFPSKPHRIPQPKSSSTSPISHEIRHLSSTSTVRSPKYTQRNTSAWAAATESAHSVLSHPPPSASSSSSPSSSNRSRYEDPLSAIHTEISNLKHSLFTLLGSSHPSLDTIAKYYFHTEGKHLRPLLVLLISQATNGLGGKGWERMIEENERMNVDDSLTTKGGVLNDWNPELFGNEGENSISTFGEPFIIPQSSSLSFTGLNSPSSSSSATSSLSNLFDQQSTSSSSAFSSNISPSFRLDSLSTSPDNSSPSILPTQRRLASITEMIHVASLLHDDVIDTSPTRRNQPSAPSEFGNKLSILSGDFLLGRASVALARLGSREVVELLATVIANLVEGEVMQLRSTSEPSTKPTKRGFEEYMRKTYLKTASLMAKSARAAVILGGCGKNEGEWVKEVAYGYGRNLGIAFQLIDDALDFLPSPDLGKPSNGADLKLGLATAPALFAWESNPQLGPLILRKFSGEGDVELAKDIVSKSDGLERTVELAKKFAGSARELVERLPDSDARVALVELTEKVVDRVK